MSPEPTPEDESSFEARLETCLLHGSVDDVVELLRSRGDVQTWNCFESALRYFEMGALDGVVADKVIGIDQPKVMARCLFEFERRDSDRGIEILNRARALARAPRQLWKRFDEMLLFLDRLRESGDGGSDGGAGDREPRPSHDPRDSSAIALEPPVDEVDFGTDMARAMARIDWDRD